jgi:hypothetical protein
MHAYIHMHMYAAQAARQHITVLSAEKDALLQDFDIYKEIAEQAQVCVGRQKRVRVH